MKLSTSSYKKKTKIKKVQSCHDKEKDFHSLKQKITFELKELIFATYNFYKFGRVNFQYSNFIETKCEYVICIHIFLKHSPKNSLNQLRIGM